MVRDAVLLAILFLAACGDNIEACPDTTEGRVDRHESSATISLEPLRSAGPLMIHAGTFDLLGAPDRRPSRAGGL